MSPMGPPGPPPTHAGEEPAIPYGAHPMDLVHEILQRLRPLGEPASLEELLDTAQLLEVTAVHARQAVSMWHDLEVARCDGNTVTLLRGSPPSQPNPSGWAQRAPSVLPGPRAVALLSLFDGMGTARLGLDDLLEHIGRRDALTHSWQSGSKICLV